MVHCVPHHYGTYYRVLLHVMNSHILVHVHCIHIMLETTDFDEWMWNMLFFLVEMSLLRSFHQGYSYRESLPSSCDECTISARWLL